ADGAGEAAAPGRERPSPGTRRGAQHRLFAPCGRRRGGLVLRDPRRSPGRTTRGGDPAGARGAGRLGSSGADPLPPPAPPRPVPQPTTTASSPVARGGSASARRPCPHDAAGGDELSIRAEGAA